MEKTYQNQPYGKVLQDLKKGYYFEPPTQRLYKESNGILVLVPINKGLEKKPGIKK